MQMKTFIKYLLALPAIAAAPAVVQAAEPADTLTARYVFENLEIPAIDLLSRSTRLDMAAYHDVGRRYDARNELGGISTLDSLTNNYASVTLTPVSSLQLMTLPYAKSGIALLSYTVDAGGPDSQLMAVDAQLRLLPSGKFFKAPVLRDFIVLPRNSSVSVRDLEDLCDFFSASYTLDAATGSVTVTPALSAVMSEENYDRLRPYITTSDGSLRTRRYVWTGKTLKLQPLE